jgi:hypothetical protein
VKTNAVPKRHHYNPQMLLRRFADAQGMLFFYNKGLPHRGVQSTQPANLFVQNHLYSFQTKDGTKDTSLETQFAALEYKADLIIEKIITCARAGREPKLNPEERRDWDSFFYYQWKRVPEMIESNSNISDFGTSLRRAINSLEKIRPLTQAEREDFQKPSTIKRMRQNAIVRSVADPGRRVLGELGKKGLGILITRKIKKSFVLGSRAIVKLTLRGRTNLSDPTVEVWLPIASDIAVCFLPGPPWERLIECSDDRHIRHLNKATFKQSGIVAGRSRALIASLAGCD